MNNRTRQPRPNRTTVRSNCIEALETRRLMSTITFNGKPGNDTFLVQGAGPHDTIVYNGNGGHDTIKVESQGSVGTIFGDVKLLNSNGGTWDVEVVNVDAANHRTVAVANGKVTGVTNGAVDYSGTTVRNLTINVAGSLGSTAAIDQAAATTMNQFNFKGAFKVNLGTATGKLDGIKNPIQINAAGNNDLYIDDLSDTADRTVTLTGTQLSGLSAKPIGYAGFDTVKVLAGSGDKKVAIKGNSSLTNFTSFDGNDTITVGDNGSFDKLTRTLNLVQYFGKTSLTYDRSADTADRSWEIDDHSVNTSGVNGVLTYSGNDTVRVLTGSGHDTVVVDNTNANEFYLSTGGSIDTVTIIAAKGHASIDTGGQEVANNYGDIVHTTDGTKGDLGWFPKGLSLKNAEFAAFSDQSNYTGHRYSLTPGALVRDGIQVASFSGAKLTALIGSGGNDVMDASTFDHPVQFEGLIGNDVLRGTAFDDNLDGQQGDDTIVGNGGIDFAAGGAGDDRLDFIGAAPKSSVDGQAGHDTLRADGQINTVLNIEAIKFPAVVSGSVFADTNKNGVWDSGDKGKAGVQVWVDVNHTGSFDAGDIAAFTDSAGNYTLRDIDPGQYAVNVLVPVGFKQTDHSGKPYMVTLGAGMKLTGIKFGVAPK